MNTALSLIAMAFCLLTIGTLACGPTAADGIPRRIQISLNATAQEFYDTVRQTGAQSNRSFNGVGDHRNTVAEQHRVGCELAAPQVAEEAAVYYRAGEITRLESGLAIQSAMERIGCIE